MPSNPEQLLGAILVRKDIFLRFETTMHDTCLDANNLLEYLFSLYNSTAIPAERDNFPSSQCFGFMRRDTNYNKKGTRRAQHSFSLQSNSVTSQLLQTTVCSNLSDTSRENQSRAADGHRKKIKVEQPSVQEVANTAAQNQDYNESVSLKAFDSHPVFPSTASSPASVVKAEVKSESESCPVHSSSPSQPFSQTRNHGSKLYCPPSAQHSDALTTPLHEDSRQNVHLNVGVDTNGEAKLQMEGTVHGVLGDQQTPKSTRGSLKHTEIARLRVNLGSKKRSSDSKNGSSSEYIGRKKKVHQCFCGALFTRADNLKRHVRKCHEEKLEKLSGVPLDIDIDNNNTSVAELLKAFPLSEQDVLGPSQPQDSLQHSHQHQEDRKQDRDVVKSVMGVKWSCFCGESFDEHRQLMEHARTHDNNT